ncbi:MAG: V-type ATP synthase subunit D [Clostridia bacterium]|nr:V-type ATP synthase subunit D [Clostridia bacterium]
MAEKLLATKGNLIIAKNTLALSKTGYSLLDKKRAILVRELMGLLEEVRSMQNEIDITFREAYSALLRANTSMGISRIEEILSAMPIDNSIAVKSRSVMGAVIPLVSYEKKPNRPPYGFWNSSAALDEAYIKFNRVKELSLHLAQVETSAYRLAVNIKKTQKRANALQNIVIPQYEKMTSDIANALEEKEREDFTRLKVIKKQKNKNGRI